MRIRCNPDTSKSRKKKEDKDSGWKDPMTEGKGNCDDAPKVIFCKKTGSGKSTEYADYETDLDKILKNDGYREIYGNKFGVKFGKDGKPNINTTPCGTYTTCVNPDEDDLPEVKPPKGKPPKPPKEKKKPDCIKPPKT
jgi:hypothetical protein